MDILGIDIAKAKFDACLDKGGTKLCHAQFSNTQAGFDQLNSWLTRHRANPGDPVRACMEATGNLGLDLALFPNEAGHQVSIVNPAQIKSFAQANLSRNKTDKLDAALIARLCRAMGPSPWQPPTPQLRVLRELVRRCEALKVNRTQEINRRKAGLASDHVAASINQHIAWLDAQIDSATLVIREIIADDPILRKNFALLRSISGFGEVTAALLIAELPRIDSFTPKALAAFVGLSPQEHSSGERNRNSGISRRSHQAKNRPISMCAQCPATQS